MVLPKDSTFVIPISNLFLQAAGLKSVQCWSPRLTQTEPRLGDNVESYPTLATCLLSDLGCLTQSTPRVLLFLGGWLIFLRRQQKEGRRSASYLPGAIHFMNELGGLHSIDCKVDRSDMISSSFRWRNKGPERLSARSHPARTRWASDANLHSIWREKCSAQARYPSH